MLLAAVIFINPMPGHGIFCLSSLCGCCRLQERVQTPREARPATPLCLLGRFPQVLYEPALPVAPVTSPRPHHPGAPPTQARLRLRKARPLGWVAWCCPGVSPEGRGQMLFSAPWARTVCSHICGMKEL